ncbi:methyltransferase domain-containing protein [Candidatus Micrarchaeota archaeon]|nr:methyltransferase domain-containing protein [Candidatus Micrarchaeota archaeon]
MNTQKYYTSNPYPDIKFESRKDVLKGPFAWRMRTILRTLNVKPNDFKGKRVLDVGCGTGEKPIYYALHGANVDAIDQSEKSIKIAKEKAGKLKVSVNFICSDLFMFKYSHAYDYVFSLGVLHHTNNPYKGFKLISQAVKPGGILTIGLYHLFGRLPTTVMRTMLSLLPISFENKKRFVMRLYARRWKNEQVIFDRYLAPYESTHTVSEVKRWFESDGFKVIGIYPKYNLSELEWFGKKSFFIISGRKNNG